MRIIKTFVIFIFATTVCLLTICFLLWGVPFPLVHIETVQNMEQVQSVAGNVIRLGSGSDICLERLSYIPTNKLISAVLGRGLRLDNGKIVGLVRIHHWCGNDPIRYDVRRVDFELLCVYVDRQCVTNCSFVSSRDTNTGTTSDTSIHVTKHGWRYDEYVKFLSFCKYFKAEI